MKFKEKLLILTVAVVLSVLGFSWIASSFGSLLTADIEASFEAAEKYQAGCNADVYRIQRINDQISQIALLCPEYCHCKYRHKDLSQKVILLQERSKSLELDSIFSQKEKKNGR